MIGFGVTGLKLLGDPNKEISGIDLKRVNVIAGFSVIIGLIALGILLMKLPLVVGFVFYTFSWAWKLFTLTLLLNEIRHHWI